jgi:hypothetical protein
MQNNAGCSRHNEQRQMTEALPSERGYLCTVVFPSEQVKEQQQHGASARQCQHSRIGSFLRRTVLFAETV